MVLRQTVVRGSGRLFGPSAFGPLQQFHKLVPDPGLPATSTDFVSPDDFALAPTQTWEAKPKPTIDLTTVTGSSSTNFFNLQPALIAAINGRPARVIAGARKDRTGSIVPGFVWVFSTPAGSPLNAAALHVVFAFSPRRSRRGVQIRNARVLQRAQTRRRRGRPAWFLPRITPARELSTRRLMSIG